MTEFLFELRKRTMFMFFKLVNLSGGTIEKRDGMKEPEHFGETVSELKIFFFFYSELRIPALYMSSVNILEESLSCSNLLPH